MIKIMRVKQWLDWQREGIAYEKYIKNKQTELRAASLAIYSKYGMVESVRQENMIKNLLAQK